MMIDALWLYVLAIFILAGLVKGVTGMGLPTVSMGLLGIWMPLPVAAALLVVPSLVTNLLQLFSGPSMWSTWRRLWLMMTLIVVGTVAGSSLIMAIDPAWASCGLGMALLVYAVYALISPALTVSSAGERWLSPLVGGVTGLITGATGVFVMPAVPYLQSLNFSKDQLVQALGLSFTISTLALAIGLYRHDALPVQQMTLSLLSTIPALLGMWLGQKVRARISARQFRRYFLLFLMVLGCELLSRPFI